MLTLYSYCTNQVKLNSQKSHHISPEGYNGRLSPHTPADGSLVFPSAAAWKRRLPFQVQVERELWGKNMEE